MNKTSIFLSLVFLAIMASLFGCQKEIAVYEVELSQNWRFKKTTDKNWDAATVPGTVHTDLINNGKIEDPYYRLNEHELQWIDKENWTYQTSFELSDTEFSKQNIELAFAGLDTYSHVFLNDSLILETDNMFRSYEVDVKPLLRKGGNKLEIVFDSPVKRGIEKYNALGYHIPVSDNDQANNGEVEGDKQVSIFTRKAGYHFGWDWGPRLVTSGIWKPITLSTWNHHKIQDVYIQQKNLGESASMVAQVEVQASLESASSQVAIWVNEVLVKMVEVKLTNGMNQFEVPFEIEQPALWWPNGMGDQVLYDVEVKVTSNSFEDTQSHQIGLRTIELVREPDAMGTSFYFKVNGHPVFMKGANYIPQDVFLTRATADKYEHILRSAKEANMNMIRVWGGGIYENDEFYEMCDEMGLLVWQDFMFACAMFPGDKAFLDNIKQEAIDNVKRLRNHTSIALWCGNNEIMVAWNNWGWKGNVAEGQSQAVADTIWKAYDDIFQKILPEVVNEFDNSRAYWPSSPGADFNETESFEKGDAHYWMVWWGKEPFDFYNTAIPRFMSEYGFQSFPEYSSVQKYTLPEDHDIYSDVMKSHQRSSIGNVTIAEYMERHYQDPKDFEHFLYVSQLLQAHGIKVGIEAHRRNRARCMGSLYWQINDCWPVASWSSIDYYGKWKALHYAAKKSFQNLSISYEPNQDSIGIHVLSDSLIDLNAELKIRLLDFEGNELKKWDQTIVVKSNGAKKYVDISKSDLGSKMDFNKVLLHTELVLKGTVIADNIHYLSPFKALKLTEPQLTYEVTESEEYFEVTLKTNKLAKDVYLSTNSTANFSDNYFDMLPNTERRLRIKKSKEEDLESFKSGLKVITLIDSYKGIPLAYSLDGSKTL